MKNQGLLITILIAVSLLLSVNASKAEQYYYYDLGASGFSVPAYGSHSINDSGYISGGTWGPGGTTAALWSPSGVIQNFGTPDGSCAVGINNKNEVVGYSADFFAGYNKAFKWTKTDGIKDLGSLSGKGGYAYGINDSGSVVGTSEAGGQSSHAFLWTPSSGMQDLGILGGQYSSASSINNSGSVVGSSDFDNIAYTRTAFLWTSSAGMKNINDLINNKPSNTYLVSASSINNKNQIVGTLNAPLPNGNSYSAYLWSASEGLKTLGSLVDGPFVGSQAYGINNNSQVVGTSANNAFSWTPSGGMQDLNTLAVNKSSSVTLNTAWSVNNNGQIVGYASNGSFLLSPTKISIDVPTPTTTPAITAFLDTSKLFTDSGSFMRNYNSSFSAPSQQFFNDNLSAVDRFLIKQQYLESPGWKFAFSFGEEFSKNFGTACSLLSLGPALDKGAEALLKNSPDLAKAYFTEATLNFANWTGKEIIFNKFNSDYNAKLALDSAQALASTGIGAVTGTLNPYSVLLTANGIIWGDIVAGQFAKLANDPPDSNFREVFQTALAYNAPFNITGLSSDMNRLLGLEFGSLYNTYYFMKGLTTSIDRYGSALAAGDTISAALQFEAFVKYLTLYDSSAVESSNYLNQLRLALINQGIPDTSYNRQAILDLQNWIRLNGLSQELIDYYKSIGLTDAEITSLVQTMLNFTPPDSISGSLYSNLLDGSNLFLYESSASSVPLPNTLILLGSGLLGLAGWRRLKNG